MKIISFSGCVSRQTPQSNVGGWTLVGGERSLRKRLKDCELSRGGGVAYGGIAALQSFVGFSGT
jgi:hypothetical protein